MLFYFPNFHFLRQIWVGSNLFPRSSTRLLIKVQVFSCHGLPRGWERSSAIKRTRVRVGGSIGPLRTALTGACWMELQIVQQQQINKACVCARSVSTCLFRCYCLLLASLLVSTANHFLHWLHRSSRELHTGANIISHSTLNESVDSVVNS